MTPLEQLERWAAGENVHNTERDECCPDFACCQPNNHFSPELRAKFLATYIDGGSEACFPMLLMGLSGAVVGIGVNGHAAEEGVRDEVGKLRAFAQKMLEGWPEDFGDIDGLSIQDAAVECGLLVGETRHEPCGEGCNCASYQGDMSGGVTCYRRTALLMGPNAPERIEKWNGNRLRQRRRMGQRCWCIPDVEQPHGSDCEMERRQVCEETAPVLEP